MLTVDEIAFKMHADPAKLRELRPDQWDHINQRFHRLLTGEPVLLLEFEHYGITVEFLDPAD
jgi:hypothetical protein